MFFFVFFFFLFLSVFFFYCCFFYPPFPSECNVQCVKLSKVLAVCFHFVCTRWLFWHMHFCVIVEPFFSKKKNKNKKLKTNVQIKIPSNRKEKFGANIATLNHTIFIILCLKFSWMSQWKRRTNCERVKHEIGPNYEVMSFYVFGWFFFFTLDI